MTTKRTRPMILIVDDDPESILLVSVMAEYAGYRVESTGRFDHARDLLDSRPAAVVLDLVMPDRTSERLLALLGDSMPDMPLILISGARRDELEVTAAQARMAGVKQVLVLAKPFWIDDMLRALSSATGTPAATGSAAIRESRPASVGRET